MACNLAIENTISGPFLPTLDRAINVDFTRPVVQGFYSAVVPLRFKSNIWFFVDPFTWKLWIIFFISIPIYIFILALSDYCYFGTVKLDEIAAFVIRNAFWGRVQMTSAKFS